MFFASLRLCVSPWDGDPISAASGDDLPDSSRSRHDPLVADRYSVHMRHQVLQHRLAVTHRKDSANSKSEPTVGPE